MRIRGIAFAVAGLAVLAAPCLAVGTPVELELRLNRKKLSVQTGITCLPGEGGENPSYHFVLDGYGDLTLPAKVNDRGATLNVLDDPGVLAMVTAIVGDDAQLGEDARDVELATARLRFSCKQGKGGFTYGSGTIKFKGTYTSGDDVGDKAKGKITLKRVAISD